MEEPVILVTDDFDRSLFNRKLKENRSTFTPVIKTILGQSFKEYGAEGDSINIGTTVSYRGIATNFEEVSCANHWTANMFKLVLTDNFNKGLLLNK